MPQLRVEYTYVSTRKARKIAGKLPAPGREVLVNHEGIHYWLRRTAGPGENALPWCLRTTDWRLVGGIATLSSKGFGPECGIRSLPAQ